MPQKAEITATLHRRLTDDQGTVGKLEVLGREYFTIELPWRNNRPGQSCIPAGDYLVRWSDSPRLRKATYEITGVEKRAGIRIHSGNLAGDRFNGWISHSLGCPLLGSGIGRIKGQRAVIGSRLAVADFERILAGRPFNLVVKDV